MRDSAGLSPSSACVPSTSVCPNRDVLSSSSLEKKGFFLNYWICFSTVILLAMTGCLRVEKDLLLNSLTGIPSIFAFMSFLLLLMAERTASRRKPGHLSSLRISLHKQFNFYPWETIYNPSKILHPCKKNTCMTYKPKSATQSMYINHLIFSGRYPRHKHTHTHRQKHTHSSAPTSGNSWAPPAPGTGWFWAHSSRKWCHAPPSWWSTAGRDPCGRSSACLAAGEVFDVDSTEGRNKHKEPSGTDGARAGLIFSPGVSSLTPARFSSQPVVLK